MTFEGLYGLSGAILYPAMVVLIGGVAEIGALLGRRARRVGADLGHLSNLTGAALGLLALLLAFSFSIALSRYDARRNVVLEEANAIGSTANFALMLPQPVQAPILGLLRDYTQVRAQLGIPYDPAKFNRDIARSVDLQNQLWRQATAVTAQEPQSLPAYRFVGSLNEVNNIHEKRLVALRYHIPVEVMVVLVAVAMMALGFAGFHAGASGVQRRGSNLVMAAAVAVLVMVIVDLDRPYRGLIKVPNQALLDAAQAFGPSKP